MQAMPQHRAQDPELPADRGDHVDKVVRDPGKKLLLEVFTGTGRLSMVAVAGPQIGKGSGCDLTTPHDQRRLMALVDACKPDLLTVDPPCWPWCGQDEASLRQEAAWERRRQHLPFWRLVAKLWEVQTKAGRLILLTQPVLSQALHLNFMQDRPYVYKAVVVMCCFGLCDPVTALPYDKKVAVETNDQAFAKGMLKGVFCRHGP